MAAHQNLYVLNATEAWEPAFAQSQMATYVAMAVSPNGRYIALFSDQGMIWVLSTDFQNNICELNTESKVAPRQLVWCGSDAVVAYWDQLGTCFFFLSFFLSFSFFPFFFFFFLARQLFVSCYLPNFYCLVGVAAAARAPELYSPNGNSDQLGLSTSHNRFFV